MAEDNLPEGAIPVEDFDPGQTSQSPSRAPSQASSQSGPGQLPPGAVPADQFVSDQNQYSSPLEQLKTTAEQVASGATLGLSKVAETKILGVKPEAIAGREAANPINSFLSNIGGGAASFELTGAAGALRGLGSVASRIAGGAGAGAVIGGVSRANDDWSQNKPLDAQKIAASAGIGALLGSAGSALGEGIKYKFGTPLAEGATKPIENTPSTASFELQNSGGEAPSLTNTTPEPVQDIPKTLGIKPSSLEEIDQALKRSKYDGSALDLPAKAELQDAISRVPLENPVNPAQLDSLNSQAERNVYQIAKESSGDIADKLARYEALQKNELVNQAQKTIQDISPGSEPEPNAYKAGQNAIDAFTDQYQDEKNALTPIFKSLKSAPLNADLLPDAVSKMTEAVPGIANMFDTTGGELGIKPYKTSWGIDKATYNATKEAVNSLSGEDSSLQTLWNVRKGLDQHIDVLAQGQAPQEIRALKAGLMDLMQESSGNPEIREAFKRYAINEQQRAVIEKAFGAGVGTPEFGALSKIKPENITDRIFANTATTNAAKQILPKEQFNVMLANWLAEAKATATDKGAFSSNKFGSFLRKNQYSLESAFSENPEQFQKLKDLTTIMRILPDAPSINPSGTAKTVMGMLKNLDLHNITYEGLIASIPKKIIEKSNNYLQSQKLNQALAGQASQNAAQTALKNHVSGINSKIERGIKALFIGGGAQSRKAE